MTDSTDNNYCDIKLPGYTLEKKIGAGGYGEVWLAHAPGGLTKAVKFIFGYHNEKRAASELHSLEKIKSVRHPFLLSLERIEVIEGRLVIVTELADGSLKDRFDYFVQNGEVGIPREELLGYLRDSADALDYLSDNHSLQHLDVKPENLLLLAGHVKVADFGLVKEIQETQASLVGGMTPLYSAPEVFQGRPTCFSDQYSLAVLFQEMLTGKLPFSGTTSAELTLQHMHDEPNLEPLPLADRYVLARALSKDPKQRYASCRDLVQALANVDNKDGASTNDWGSRPAFQTPTHTTSSSSPNVDVRQSRLGTMTQVFEDDLIGDPAEVSKSMMLDMPEAIEQEETQLPTLNLKETEFQPTPTLVIGIGGTAGHVLSRLRKRMSNRFGEANNVPAVQFLLLDTDKKALLEATHGNAGAGLTVEETLALQLRRPQEYRDHSKRLLGWLSRRWLYNIPKSLRTEGLRPLGRLAFADHARRTIQRIRLALFQAMDGSSVEQSSEQTGLHFAGQGVRVYVVASISGGTGSGMSIDIGFAVKSLLEKLGIENATTTGVFLHSTGRDSRFCDLAKVNAFSWFKEYHHFARPEGFYPGDEASGLPAMPVGAPAFDNTYFIKLGDGLSPEQLKENADSVAQYLMLDTLTAAQTFFATSRDALPTTIEGCPTLRTFGLHEESAASQQALDALSQQLCQQVVLGWSGAEPEITPSNSTHESRASEENQETASLSDTSHIICGAPRAVAQLQLNLEGISANARTLLESQFGTNIESMLAKLLRGDQQENAAVSPAEVVKLVDTLFAAPPDSGNISSREFVLGRRLDAIVSPLGMKLASDLQRWLIHRLDESQERLAGTRQATEWFAKHLQRVEADAHRLAKAIGNKLVTMLNQYNSVDSSSSTASKGSSDVCLELAIKYFRLRLDLRSLQATSHLVRTLQTELKNVGEAIVEFGRHLRNLADRLTHVPDADTEQQACNRALIAQDPICQMLLTSLNGLTAKVDQQLQEQYINQQGGMFQTVMGNRKVMVELLDTLQTISEQHIASAARELSMSGVQALDSESLAKHAQQARPSSLDLGGVASQLVILPQQENTEELSDTVRDVLGCETSLLTGTEGNLVVCCEAGQLPLARVAVDLIECRRDYAEFADRVHTRNDISWVPLIDVPAPAPMNHSESATQVLSQVL